MLIINFQTAIFGMYLTPQKVGNAELTIGGLDTSKYTGSLTYAALPSGAGDWEIPSSAISVNGKTSTTLTKSRSVIFDSGTSNVLFDTKTTEVIQSLLI